jgi:hypothetical protein
MSEINQAATLLRELGWTCIPPVDPSEAIPEAKIGQVWISPKPRVEARTVVWIGASRTQPWAGDKCVGFTTPTRKPHEKWGPSKLTPEAWAQWAKKSGARPVPVQDAPHGAQARRTGDDEGEAQEGAGGAL